MSRWLFPWDPGLRLAVRCPLVGMQTAGIVCDGGAYNDRYLSIEKKTLHAKSMGLLFFLTSEAMWIEYVDVGERARCA